MWCVSSVPKPESTTRRRSALPSPSVSFEVQQLGAVGDVDAAVAGLDAGRDQQAVGEDASSCRPGRRRRCLRGRGSCRSACLAGLDLRIDLAELATQSRPAGSKFIWIGLASSGSAAKRLTSKPSATTKDLRSISGSGSGSGMSGQPALGKRGSRQTTSRVCGTRIQPRIAQ